MEMQYKIIFCVTVFLCSANRIYAQPGLRNAIYLELGGTAYYYSINYERQSPRGLTARIGLTYFANTFVIPLTVGKVYGSKDHHFEMAGGMDFARNGKTDNKVGRSEDFVAITAFIGYRYQKSEKRFFAKAGFTPIWQVYESNYTVELMDRPFYPWLGIGLGHRF